MKNNEFAGIRRSKEQRQALIEQWRQSGKSKKAFCLENRLNYLTFIAWTCPGKRGFVRFGNRNNPGALGDGSGFVPLTIGDNGGSPFASVSYSNGCSITLHQSVTVQYLRNLAK